MPSYKPVTAALRVLEVLAAVNRLGGRGSIGDIHYQTGIDKSTIVRMLETLISAGYVIRSVEGPAYRVTGKTLALSASFDRHLAFVDILSPILSAFRDEIGWPSDVALFDHDAMLVIETSRALGPLSFNRSTGYRAPVLGTSLGLAYLAHSAQEEQERFLEAAREDPAPWNEIAQDREAFEQRMAEVRRQGFATMDPAYSQQEYANRIFSIGVPILHDAEVFASLNIIYLRQALTPAKARQDLLPRLTEVAAEMGKALAERMSPQ
ncbi:MAG: IclR family transcriptional regulator C-terminal domain-containing protein [Pseudomonadota bacterium]